ncbi:MAG: hypothetical protein RLZZ15_2044 [Verrucomicrobiota bacterium]|jgi:hypothetical protein
MPAKSSPADFVIEADNILKVWLPNPAFTLKDLTVVQYQAHRDELDNILTELKKKDDEVAPLRNRRDDLLAILGPSSSRVRSGIKGYFGEDSTEYELAGGTRASERKRSGPKAKPAAPPEKP